MTIFLSIIGILILLSVAYLIYLQTSTSDKSDLLEQHQMLTEFHDRINGEIQNIRKEITETTGKGREEVQNRLDHISKEMLDFQKSTSNTLQDQHNHSQKIIKDITEKLTEIGGTNKQVLGFAEQMKSLEHILKNPKQRGILGEYFLETLLSNVLVPQHYEMQYRFKSGEIVDAVVHFNKLIVPIDSKFSLEKYNRMMEAPDKEQRQLHERNFHQDVKKRIDETSKYIRPTEGTTDFAFMFIPAEGIYYNLLSYKVGSNEVNAENLVEYAFKKHVIIVSPTSFYAYLLTVMQGLNALKIEESVKEIRKRVDMLGKHLRAFSDFMHRLGKNLGTTVSSYNHATAEFKKIDKDVVKITEGSEGGSFEPMNLDKPQLEES